MWQKGKTLGVVGFDHDRGALYTAQPRWKTQKLFLEEVQAMSLQERNVNILVFLADLEYFEQVHDLTMKICVINFSCLYLKI